MTTDTKPSNTVDIEAAESNDDADIKIFGNNPEYQLDVYQMALEYREARQKIASHAIVFIPLLSGIEIMISKYYVFNSKHIFIPLFLLIGSSITFAIYFVAGIGYKLRKPWADNLLEYGIIPCLMSFNFFSITVALIIYKSHCRLKEIVLYISNHHIDIDLDEMSENIISPKNYTQSKFLIDIPLYSRLYYLERFIFRQILDPYYNPLYWEIFQTPKFRQAARTISRLPEIKKALGILIFIVFFIHAMGNMAGIILWTKVLIYSFLPVQFIIVHLISFKRHINTILSLFRCGIYLLLIYLQFILIISFQANNVLSAIINLVLIPPIIIVLIVYYLRLTRAFEIINNSKIKYIDTFINKYGLLHCILRTYQKRFILSEESGWDENDKTTDHTDSNLANSTDWQFNTDRKEKQ